MNFTRRELLDMGRGVKAYQNALEARFVSAAESMDVLELCGKVSDAAWSEIRNLIMPEQQRLLDLEIESAEADEEWEKGK